MADQDSPNSNNGSGPENAPQIGVLTQYVKDLSVESPNSPAVFQWETQPQVDVQFGINAEKVSDEVHEVTLKVNVGARSDNGVHFLVGAGRPSPPCSSGSRAAACWYRSPSRRPPAPAASFRRCLRCRR